MRVGISLLTLAPGDLGGSETYARQLVKALSSVGTHEYAVFVPARAKDAAGRLPAIEVKEPPVVRRGPLRIGAMALKTFRSKKVQTKLDAVDVVHYALTVPLPRTTTPTVVTLHDVQHRDLPDFFGPARRSFRRIAYDRATQSAGAVIVTSEFVRGRALDQLALDPTRVHVVPHAINHTLFKEGDEEREAFLLYPARAWPHKNHSRLFEAFAILRRHDPKLRLILTGGGLERLGQLPDGVERWGIVPPRSSRRSTVARRASSSRACTRASGCRRSRRWRAGAPSRRRTSRRSPRSAATRRCSSTPMTPSRSRTPCSRPTHARASCARRGSRASRDSPGSRRRARTTTSTRQP